MASTGMASQANFMLNESPFSSPKVAAMSLPWAPSFSACKCHDLLVQHTAIGEREAGGISVQLTKSGECCRVGERLRRRPDPSNSESGLGFFVIKQLPIPALPRGQPPLRAADCALLARALTYPILPAWISHGLSIRLCWCACYPA